MKTKEENKKIINDFLDEKEKKEKEEEWHF